ncbi:hypothetical protein BBJ28_00022782 [Nothophytophthora sp. Chile5]|nr:hypothetical protein BBJ28_00022782 [Nothophytophthora sp. Chile5]
MGDRWKISRRFASLTSRPIHQATEKKMPTGRAKRRHVASQRLQLLLDVALVLLFFVLDARDLWFKLSWMGPRNSFSFATSEPGHLVLRPSADPLESATAFSYSGQAAQRASGWSSFLEKCESLSPFSDGGEDATFQHVLGKNCMIGAPNSAVPVPELVLSSSVRVDSMAWSACKLLYHHRKPPICHSPIVTQFSERYNMREAPSAMSYPPSADLTFVESRPQERVSATPGSDAEMELVELLSVISKSSPLSAVVCVEGFIPNGSGRYASSIFGCGSPSYYRSAFVGRDATFFSSFQQDKAWLTSDVLHVMGMRFLMRENRRSLFTLRALGSDSGGGRVLEHASLLNFSTSGSLYTILILVDAALLLLNVCSAVEIGRCMLWPLWKPLIVTEYQTWSAHARKMGFVLGDYARAFRVTLFRSTPVALLTLVSRLLSWLLVFPSLILWTDGHFGGEDVHALLTVLRVWVIVTICVRNGWNMVVALDEKRALAVVRRTYISTLEVAAISLTVASCFLSTSLSNMSREKSLHERQLVADSTSFVGFTAFANTFPAQQDSLQNTPMATLAFLYSPLLAIVGWSIVLVAVLAAVRFLVGIPSGPRSLIQRTSAAGPLIQPGATVSSSDVSATDDIDHMSNLSAGILMRSSSPPPSPTRGVPAGNAIPTSTAQPMAPTGGRSDTESFHDERLPVEDIVDIPIRAQSLVRDSWAVMKMVGSQVLLLPPYYLEHGIVLASGSMKTRCGFLDVVQPIVLAKEHEQRKEGGEREQKATDRSIGPIENDQRSLR